MTDQPTDPPAEPPIDPRADPTPPRRPRPTTGPVQYKGDALEAERGPGLGCFRFQVVILVIFIVLTPLSVVWNWPPVVSTILLFSVILLLLFTGQTIIFLLRLVSADRRGRRRPLASGTRTVGELEDAAATPSAAGGDDPAADDARAAEPGRTRRRLPTPRRRTSPTGADAPQGVTVNPPLARTSVPTLNSSAHDPVSRPGSSVSLMQIPPPW